MDSLKFKNKHACKLYPLKETLNKNLQYNHSNFKINNEPNAPVLLVFYMFHFTYRAQLNVMHFEFLKYFQLYYCLLLADINKYSESSDPVLGVER